MKIGSTILIENFKNSIEVTEVNQLFQQFGQILEIKLLWKPSMSQTCSAEVTFKKRESSEKAKKTYNEANLDNLILKISLMN